MAETSNHVVVSIAKRNIESGQKGQVVQMTEEYHTRA